MLFPLSRVAVAGRMTSWDGEETCGFQLLLRAGVSRCCGLGAPHCRMMWWRKWFLWVTEISDIDVSCAVLKISAIFTHFFLLLHPSCSPFLSHHISVPPAIPFYVTADLGARCQIFSCCPASPLFLCSLRGYWQRSWFGFTVLTGLLSVYFT